MQVQSLLQGVTQDEYSMLAMNVNWEEGVRAVSPQIPHSRWKDTSLHLKKYAVADKKR